MSKFNKDVAEALINNLELQAKENRINRSYNADNPHQDYFNHKRVLCVCSAGLLRSPTTAVVLSQEPYNYNTRAAGLVPSFALVAVDGLLLQWADEIVCMTKGQKVELENLTDKPIICLDIQDSFAYRDPKLIELIKERYDSQTNSSDETSNKE